MNREGLIITISCPDSFGLVSRLSSFIADHKGNLVELHQFTDEQAGLFFARLTIDIEQLDVSVEDFISGFDVLARAIKADWEHRLFPSKMRTALLVTQTDHCLNDILWRAKSGELPIEITSVIGNRETCREAAESAGLPFHFIDMKGDAEKKDSGFRRIHELLKEQDVELVVLARFMQILPDWFCKNYEGRTINIHHSFLPAFIGANPYKQAYDRGVKLIGATCHYVTPDLDAGPIIQQEVQKVEHFHTPSDLVRLGRDCERRALSTGIRYHAYDRIIISGNRAIVFPD